MQPRAQGRVEVSAKLRDGRSVIDGLYQQGSLKCLFPRAQGSDLDAVLLNTAGGVTGGDRFDVAVQAGPGSTLTLTTQACERAYKAQMGERGTLVNTLRADPGAQINWLPQETLIFDGAALHRSLSVDLAPDATLLAVEPVIFGRAAMGEEVHSATFHDRIALRRDGVPLYLDAIALEGDIAAQMDAPAVGAGARALATILFAHPRAEAALTGMRQLLPETAGASLLRPDLLVARVLARDGFALRQTLIPVLARLHHTDIPRCWMT